MQNSQLPSKFTIPFANSAGAGFIRAVPVASQIGITSGAASLTDGFPPVTFQPVGAGGTPPFGQDFNGLFQQITAWNRWAAAGGSVQFDQTFCNAIGGYPTGAIVQSTANAQLYWLSIVDNNTTNPDGGSPSGWIAWGPASIRPLAINALTYFVNASTGNDSNNGLASGTAFATIQKAANVIGGFDLNNNSATVNVANGTYGAINLPQFRGGTVTFTGNPSLPSSVLISNSAGSALRMGNAGTVIFNGVTFAAAAAGTGGDAGWGIDVFNGGAQLNLQNVGFNFCFAGWLESVAASLVAFTGTLTINGGTNSGPGFDVQTGANINLVPGSTAPALTISSAVTVSVFMQARNLGVSLLTFSSITNPGNVTGQKYNAIANGIINTGGAGVNFFPGTVAGATATGGQYL